MAEITLTKEQKAHYLTHSSSCPLCGSSNLDGGFVEVTDGGANQEITCGGCEARWWDLYTLTDITPIDDGK